MLANIRREVGACQRAPTRQTLSFHAELGCAAFGAQRLCVPPEGFKEFLAADRASTAALDAVVRPLSYGKNSRQIRAEAATKSTGIGLALPPSRTKMLYQHALDKCKATGYSIASENTELRP
jgi:hypothetical protein